MSHTGTSPSWHSPFSSICAFPNVDGTSNQSLQINVPHQSSKIFDFSIYGGNGSISLDYSQNRSAIASGKCKNQIENS